MRARVTCTCSRIATYQGMRSQLMTVSVPVPVPVSASASVSVSISFSISVSVSIFVSVSVSLSAVDDFLSGLASPQRGLPQGIDPSPELNHTPPCRYGIFPPCTRGALGMYDGGSASDAGRRLKAHARTHVAARTCCLVCSEVLETRSQRETARVGDGVRETETETERARAPLKVASRV